MLRFGPRDGPVVVAAPALFEEGNRTRAFLVRVLRMLAERGIGSVLPDLPGQGESLTLTDRVRLADWRAAFAAAAASTGGSHVLSVRGGALVDAECTPVGRYHLSPVDGAALLKDLRRAALVGMSDTALLAGNRVSSDLIRDLEAATLLPASDRTVRLESDPRSADLKLPGRPLWRASEPDVDERLAVALADDVAAWVRACGAS
jgi:hypothetical protein